MVVALAGGVLLTSCSTGTASRKGGSPTTSITPALSTTTTTVSHGTPQWLSYGHDLSNTRTNTAETAITPASVSRLQRRWSKSISAGVAGTPVVSDGIVYFGSLTGTAYALSLSNGSVVWSTYLGAAEIVGSPAVTQNAALFGLGNTLYRLDRRNGKIQWRATTNPSAFSQINASPVVVGNLVLIGTAQFEEVVGKPPATFRGSIGAFNLNTGKRVWNFITTADNKRSGAGEGVWSTPCVDPAAGLLFVGTGQNISKPTGPLADSLLAIDYRTGKLKWYKQFTYPDVFGVGNFSGKDADVGASPNLWTVGSTTVVGVGQKNGTYHALNAANGKEIWNTRITPGSSFGGVLGSAALADGRIIASSNIGNPHTNSVTSASKIVALDPATGKVLWSDTEVGDIFGPVSAVPGVAFVGTVTNPLGKVSVGKYLALSTSTGKTLWTFTPPAHVGGGASIVDGNLVWGYGFPLFSGAGAGGVIDFTLS